MSEIAIAFDVATLDEALDLDRSLGAGPEMAKIGLQLFTAAGPAAVAALRARGRRVFLDLKLHDIPNTVRGAAAAAAGTGAELITVHAMGGPAMIAAAVEGATRGAAEAARRGGGAADRHDRGAGADGQSAAGCGVVAVTLLTSLDPARLPPGFAQPFAMPRVIAELLAMSEAAGARGIVCAASDLGAVRAERGADPFYAVTPGIRPAGGATHDQQRVTTVADAVRLGASLMVLGRAITAAPDPRAALEAARAERDQALAPTRR